MTSPFRFWHLHLDQQLCGLWGSSTYRTSKFRSLLNISGWSEYDVSALSSYLGSLLKDSVLTNLPLHRYWNSRGVLAWIEEILHEFRFK